MGFFSAGPAGCKASLVLRHLTNLRVAIFWWFGVVILCPCIHMHCFTKPYTLHPDLPYAASVWAITVHQSPIWKISSSKNSYHIRFRCQTRPRPTLLRKMLAFKSKFSMSWVRATPFWTWGNSLGANKPFRPFHYSISFQWALTSWRKMGHNGLDRDINSEVLHLTNDKHSIWLQTQFISWLEQGPRGECWMGRNRPQSLQKSIGSVPG